MTILAASGDNGSSDGERSTLAHADFPASSPVARQAHNLKVAGSNPAPATISSCPTPQSGLDFHARLKNADGSLFFSPCSSSTCLAMSYAVAHGSMVMQRAWGKPCRILG